MCFGSGWPVTPPTGYRGTSHGCPADVRQRGVIEVHAERIFNGAQMGLVAVCGELYVIAEVRGPVLHEALPRARIARPDGPARTQLRVGVECGPCPDRFEVVRLVSCDKVLSRRRSAKSHRGL